MRARLYLTFRRPDAAADAAIESLFSPNRSSLSFSVGAIAGLSAACCVLFRAVWWWLRPRLQASPTVPPSAPVTLTMGELTLTLGDASDLSKIPEDLKAIFRAAGVRRRDLEDDETRQLIAQTLDARSWIPETDAEHHERRMTSRDRPIETEMHHPTLKSLTAQPPPLLAATMKHKETAADEVLAVAWSDPNFHRARAAEAKARAIQATQRFSRITHRLPAALYCVQSSKAQS